MGEPAPFAGKAGAIYAMRRPKQGVYKAPQPLNTKRGCYGKPFSGIRGRSRKMALRCQAWREGVGRDRRSRGLVHPRTSIGGGARWRQVLAKRGRRIRWEGPEGAKRPESPGSACSGLRRGRWGRRRDGTGMERERSKKKAGPGRGLPSKPVCISLR